MKKKKKLWKGSLIDYILIVLTIIAMIGSFIVTPDKEYTEWLSLSLRILANITLFILLAKKIGRPE
jgi:hypothetical protein